MRQRRALGAALLLALACCRLPLRGATAGGSGARARHAAEPGAGANHTSNWALLVCTSAYWYNYRHMANTLSLYRTVRRLGIPDSNIVLMLADDVACNARNPYPAQVFNDERHRLDVYGQDVEVDYRGHEVTVENFMRVLTGRHDPAVPRAKRLLSDEGSNILVFITGHGGNEFIKFQDQQELMAADVADALAQMHLKGRYRELLLMVETCQASTLYSRIKSPGVLTMASSLKGESSYSYLTDYDIGLSLVDRFTYATLDFFERVGPHSHATLRELFDVYRYEHMDSHFGSSTENFARPLSSVRVTEFFGHVTRVTQLAGSYPYSGRPGADGERAHWEGSDADTSSKAPGAGSSQSHEGDGGLAGSCVAADSGLCAWDGAGGGPAVMGRLAGGGGIGSSRGGGGGGGCLDALTLCGVAALLAAMAAAAALASDTPGGRATAA